MEQVAISLAISLGLSAEAAKTLAELGPWGLLALALATAWKLGILQKVFSFYKAFSILPNLLEAVNKIHQALVENGARLDEQRAERQDWKAEVRSNCKTTAEAISSVKLSVNSLLSQNTGIVDERRASVNFHSQIDKLHKACLVHYHMRKEANHILDHSEIVANRYITHAESMAGKCIKALTWDELGGTLPLAMFWGQGGAEGYFRHIATDLYYLHLLQAQGDREALAVTTEDIQSAMDRCLSKLLGAFAKWLEDSTLTYASAYALSGHIHLNIYPPQKSPNNEIEKL